MLTAVHGSCWAAAWLTIMFIYRWYADFDTAAALRRYAGCRIGHLTTSDVEMLAFILCRIDVVLLFYYHFDTYNTYIWEGSRRKELLMHIGTFCEFASFGSFPRAYFMCNWAEILIYWSHCISFLRLPSVVWSTCKSPHYPRRKTFELFHASALIWKVGNAQNNTLAGKI